MSYSGLIKAFRASMKVVLGNLGFKCSVCIQNIDTYVMSFANMEKASMSWGRKELCLFDPKRSTFKIPYKEIEIFSEIPDRKQIEIVLRGRILVSIREIK